MKIVIDIPEGEYNTARFMGFIHRDIIFEAIKNGAPLPKGYGRLIDADAYLTNTPIRKSADDTWIKESYVYKSIMDAPTIIEADREVSE